MRLSEREKRAIEDLVEEARQGDKHGWLEECEPLLEEVREMGEREGESGKI